MVFISVFGEYSQGACMEITAFFPYNVVLENWIPFGEQVSSPYVHGYFKTVSRHQFSIAVIGNMHRGTLREWIDRAFHLRSRWQLSILCNSP